MTNETQLPHITVVVPSYDEEKTDILKNCVDSVLSQDYPSFDVLVITEGESLTSDVENMYSEHDDITIEQITNTEGGVSVARNEGFKRATGDVVAYIDSDARANSGWLRALGEVYRDENVLSVGGRAEPDWETKRPWYLPDSFLWIVGATHSTHPKDGEFVRSTFGCNLSYRRDVLDSLNGFNDELGKDHGFNLQGEEPELGIRLRKEFNTGVYYASDAVVRHTVEPYQCTYSWLLRRAYLQGVTKSMIEHITPETRLDTEQDYLQHLLLNTIPHHIGQMFLGPNRKKSCEYLFGVVLFTFFVGIGYLRGKVNTYTNS